MMTLYAHTLLALWASLASSILVNAQGDILDDNSQFIDQAAPQPQGASASDFSVVPTAGNITCYPPGSGCVAVYNTQCYKDVRSAVTAAQSSGVPNGVVYITGNSTVSKWISLTSDLTVVAAKCDYRPLLTANFAGDQKGGRGLFDMRVDNVTLKLAGFDMTMDVKEKHASAIRSGITTLGLGLVLEDMRLYGFNMDALGGAVYLNDVSKLFVDNSTVFRKNVNSDNGEGGGAGMYIGNVSGDSQVNVMGLYEDNYIENQEGGGAGIRFENVNGSVFINGLFRNNFAVGGSAVYVLNCFSNCMVNFDGEYYNNSALRGTVLVQQTWGNVYLPGKYHDNTAHLGAVIRLNRIWNGVLYMSGLFLNNKAFLLDFEKLVVGKQPQHDSFSKGGVITFWSLNGTIEMSGDFISNTATYTGGVFDIDEDWYGATPVKTPTVKMSGRFYNNVANERGGVAWIKRIDTGGVLELSGEFGGNEAEKQDNIIFIHDNKLKVTSVPPGQDLATDPIMIVPTSDPDWRDGWGKFTDAVEWNAGNSTTTASNNGTVPSINATA